MKYGPYVCIGFILLLLVLICLFFGGGEYNFVGLAPLLPETCGSYTGSIYNWGNITPAVGYDPIQGKSCLPPDIVCKADNTDQSEIVVNQIEIDMTPTLPEKDIITIEPAIDTIENQPPNPVCNGLKPRKNKFISRGERLCKETLEKIYGKEFITIRPPWLTNPETNRPLELDCYNDELKLAVEYNGEQHYKWPNFTGQSYEEFINQIRRDKLKSELCEKNGIYLITVPYKISYDDISSYIISHLPDTVQHKNNIR